MSHWLYEGIVTRVYDADTITVDLDMGMRVWQKGVSVRLAGVNAPELNTVEGKIARDAVVQLAPLGSRVVILSHRFEKYGRLLATITLNDGTNLNSWLVANGRWCSGATRNRRGGSNPHARLVSRNRVEKPQALGKYEIPAKDGSDVAVEGRSRAGACAPGATWARRLGEREAA